MPAAPLPELDAVLSLAARNRETQAMMETWIAQWRKAVDRQDTGQMEALLAAPDPEKLAAALVYAGERDCLDGMRLLLKAGVDPTVTLPDGRFALSYIVRAGREKAVQLLLDHGARPDELSKGDGPPLHAAAEEGDAEILRRLLRAGVKDEITPDWEESALQIAARKGYLEAARVLLDGGSPIDACREYGRTPLVAAAEAGQVEMVRLLLERGADPNAPAWTTPLMAAARRGRDRVVELLLAHGVAVTAQDSRGLTPLHFAEEGDSPAVVQLLLQAGAEVDARDCRGRTPLMIAAGRRPERLCYRRSKEICGLLVTAGADVNAATPEKRGPLLLAAAAGDAPRVELLLEAGARVDAASCWGWTPLMAAMAEGHRAVVRLLLEAGAPPLTREMRRQIALLKALASKRWLLSRILLEFGAGVNCVDDAGQTPLHLALDGRPPRLGLVKKLLAAGADVNRLDADGCPPLFRIHGEGFAHFVRLLAQAGADLNLRIARHGGTTKLLEHIRLCHIEEAEALIVAGADVNTPDLHGRTPLMWAAFSAPRDPERRLLRALLAAGADVAAVDAEGKTAKDWAVERNHLDLLQILEEHPAPGQTRPLADTAAN